jgi:pimeloyl-ACP methyl ester carboxylesterase
MFYYHGWPSSRLQGRILHHLARERGLRVLALDRPGMGQSTHVPKRTLDAWPLLIAAFADSHGISRFAQLGVSGGGPYVLACAAHMPDRVMASAVLCGAVPLWNADHGGLHPVYRIIIPLRRLPKACFTPFLRLGNRLVNGSLLRPPASWVMQALPEADRNLLLDHPEAREIFIESCREGVRQGASGVMDDGEIYINDWGIRLDDIRHPIHYWHGAMDRHISAGMAQRFVSRIAGAALTIDPVQGHFSLAVHRAPDAMDYLQACCRVE